jgi:hypothetical protein
MNSAEIVLTTMPIHIQHSPLKVIEYAHTKVHNCLGLDDVHRTTIEFADGSKLRPCGKHDGRLPDLVWAAEPQTPRIDRERPRINIDVKERLKRKQD